MSRCCSRLRVFLVLAVAALAPVTIVPAAGSDLALEDVWSEGPVTQAVLDSIEDAVSDALRGRPIPGLMVGFEVGGVARGILSFGWSDLETQTPMQAGDSFYIGSSTKMFTATAILQLAEQGLVDLDDPISMYLEDIPRTWRGVTIRHLLEHTSGIPSYIGTEEGQALRWTSEPISYETVLEIMAHQPIDFPPGTDWNYTNSNFYLLGHIVESVSELGYGEYLDTHIFNPLGMYRSGCDTSSRPSRLVTAYRRDDVPAAQFEVYPLPNVSLLHGAGGIHSTMEDVLRWLDGWSGEGVLSKASLDLMVTPRNIADLPLGDKYGMGCMIWDARWTGLPLHVGHFGMIHGNLCLPWVFPEEGVSLVLYSNSYDLLDVLMEGGLGSPNALHRKLAEILIDFAEATP
jgi:D-alanyl-D-alanine carboxypeptidase